MIAAAVLAAGRGTRFGGTIPKPLVRFRGRPLVAHALDAARASGCAPVLLVVGHESDAVAVVAPPDAEVVRNPHHDEGIATSLHAVLRTLEGRTDVDGVVVGLADQPLVGADAYRRVAAAYDAHVGLAVATYGGTRANPVLLARSCWREAAALAGDEGARALLRRHPSVAVPCDGTGLPTDVDTPAELADLEARCASRTDSE